MRKLIVVAAALAMLTVVNLTIHSREQLIDSGRVVLLELAPVDPRSLMQGDYMALRFKVAREILAAQSPAALRDGNLVLGVDGNGVAAYRRIDNGAPLAPDEVRLRFRIRNGAPRLATNAFFFEEGHAKEYVGARYGEFRVASDGESVLTGLRDGERAPLGARPGS
jgi:uncharacterized membrane-anchored protein